MTRVLILGRAGSINRERIAAVVTAKSAPIKRMLKATDASRIIDMTYGYPRQSVIIMDNGFIILSSRHQHDVARVLGLCKEQTDEELPILWSSDNDL